MVKYGKRNQSSTMYSRYNRRRYFKKSLGRAKTFSKAVAVSKYLKTNMQNIKCTFHDSISILPSQNIYAFLSSIGDFINMSSILAASPEFISRYSQYSYYKINGIAFILSRKWLDPISYGVDGVSKGFTAGSYCLSKTNLALESDCVIFKPFNIFGLFTKFRK